MAIFHLHVEPKKRQCERSSILGSAAYRAAVRLTDARGQVFDFRRKTGVLETQLFLPPQTPPKLRSLQGLWRAVEAAEPAKGRATWAQEVEVALPVELSHEEHEAIIWDFVRPHVEAGHCVQVSYEDDGGGNPHAHILISARKLGSDGQWLEKEKTRTVYANCYVDGKPSFDSSLPTGPETRIPRLDAQGQQIVQLRPGRTPQPQWERVKVSKPQNDLFDKSTLQRWRAEWAGCVNRRLLEHGLPLIDHRSYKKRGIDRIPQRHLGPWATQLEKRGQRSRRGDWNRAVRRLNALQASRQAREEALEAAAAKKAQRQAWQREIQEQIADQRFGDAIFMALCDDAAMRTLWIELDRIERQLALKKLQKSCSQGKAESAAKPLVSRLVAGLFEAAVAPALEAERKAQEEARKAALEAAQKAKEEAAKAAQEKAQAEAKTKEAKAPEEAQKSDQEKAGAAQPEAQAKKAAEAEQKAAQEKPKAAQKATEHREYSSALATATAFSFGAAAQASAKEKPQAKPQPEAPKLEPREALLQQVREAARKAAEAEKAREKAASEQLAQKKAEEEQRAAQEWAERERQRKAEEEAAWAEVDAAGAQWVARFEAEWAEEAEEQAEQRPQPQQQEPQQERRKGRAR